jgi:hypothetical protein
VDPAPGLARWATTSLLPDFLECSDATVTVPMVAADVVALEVVTTAAVEMLDVWPVVVVVVVVVVRATT